MIKDRGVVISADGGRKEQLIDKVYYAKQLGLEVLRTEQQITKDIAERRKEKLTFDGVLLPFPENFHNWLKRSEYPPDTTLSDLENYFKANDGMKGLAEGKSLFESGHVSGVEYNGISNRQGVMLLLKKTGRILQKHHMETVHYWALSPQNLFNK